MNKKFSTLVAGLLLAGGAFSSAYADKLSTVADNGKFYKLEEGAFINGTSGSFAAGWDNSADARGWFIDLDDETNVAYLSRTTNDYWTVTKVYGTAKYELTNLFGEKLTIAGESQFELGETGLNGYQGPTDLSQLKGTVWFGYNATPVSGRYELQDQTGNYAAAWDAQETSLRNLRYSRNVLEKDATYRIVVPQNDGDHYVTDMLKASYNSTLKTWSFKWNSDGSQFTIGSEVDFKVIEAGNGYVLYLPSTRGYVKYDETAGLTLADDLEHASIIGFAATNSREAVPVKVLNYYEKDGFSVGIYYDTEKDNCLDPTHLSDALEGNPFVGHLKTMKYSNGEFSEITNGASRYSFWLQNEEGKYIVAVPYDVQTALTSESLYKFITVSETELVHNLVRAANGQLTDQQKYYGEFAAYVDEAALQANPEAIDEITWLRVKVKNGNLATVGNAFISQKATLAAAEDEAWYNNTRLFDVLISLNAGQVVSKYDLVKAKFYTVEKLNAKGESEGHLVAKANGTAWEESYGNDLEGQFALVVSGNNYQFTNRENPNAVWSNININRLYTTDKADTYKYAGVSYVIKTVDTDDADGYKRFSDSELNRTYNIAFSSNVFGNNAYFVENHADGDLAHVIGLETATDNALVFNMKKYNAARNLTDEQANHTYNYHPSDSIYVISHMGYYNAKKAWIPVEDTLKVLAYSFVNQWNEPLMYNGTPAYDKAKNTYYSKVYKNDATKVKYASAAEAHAEAQRFVIRYDANSTSKYNLRPIDKDDWKGVVNETEIRTVADLLKLHQSFNEYGDDLAKVYAGDAAEGILNNTGLYSRTENDLFVIEETEKEVYRSLAAANENGTQTISIYREGAEKTLLFENGEFLGLANIAEFPKMAPAMLADTAYVRYETYKPQYLLVVNPTVVPAGTYCPIHGENATCEHATETKGWVEGRYLVNLVDSAKAWDKAHKHQAGNPYKNTEGLYKLGFVQATHKKDSLIIASDDKQIFLGNNKNVNGKYAFRYVDTAAKSFTIETTLDGSNTPGYLKWMNGVVVAVADVKNADVFNLNEDEDRTPTANEAVAAEVSVVAVKGAIIVKGAAGKVVTVANILGQTIANQVAASDNVTIAAPAGIAVVTVDGEATKVVVK